MRRPPDFSLPALDLRLIGRRAALPLALAAVALAVVLLAGGPLRVLADSLSRALSADPRWIAFAAVAELLSFAGYIALFWLIGRRASPRLDLRDGAEITLAGAAATRLLPTAGAGGAALTLWSITKAGMGPKHAGRVLLTFLSLLYGVFLRHRGVRRGDRAGPRRHDRSCDARWSRCGGRRARARRAPCSAPAWATRARTPAASAAPQR